ncbi:MAG: hypothetical protein JSV44_06770, partial [Candidatus Zixiibacteriota bacterium]
MKAGKILIILLILFFFTANAVFAFYPNKGDTGSVYELTRIIVKFKAEAALKARQVMGGPRATGLEAVDRLNAGYGVQALSPLMPAAASRTSLRDFGNVFVLTLPGGLDIETAAKEYSLLSEVEYAEPDYPVKLYNLPNDDLFSFQWNLHNVGQEHYHVVRHPGYYNDTLVMDKGIADSDIDAGEVFINPPDNTVTAVVAILDTGVDFNHADLADNMWVNPREVPENGVDDDNNGYIDDVH